MEELLKLNNTTWDYDSVTPTSEKKPALQQKPFIWDRVIFVLASIIFGLSISGVVAEYLNSAKNNLACFSLTGNQAQYTYINSYCHKYIPITEYFSVVLMLHVAALVVPHYLWKVFFSAQIECFFSQVDKLKTLHDRDTEKYPQMNHDIVVYLKREFGDRKAIFKSYIVKLFLQFLLISTSLAVNMCIFHIDSDITFECYDDNEDSQLFGNVTCAYPRKLFINVLQVSDYCLLSVAIIIVTIALFWNFMYNHSESTEDDKIAQFCYDSGINPKYCSYLTSKKMIRCCQMDNDFKFLLASLLATHSGLRRVFKAILIEDTILLKFRGELQGSHIAKYYFNITVNYDICTFLHRKSTPKHY